MPVFMVERHLPGITLDALQAAGLRAKTCCEGMSDEGKQIRYIRSVFNPDTEQCFCTFAAPDKSCVADANERARIPFTMIHEVLELGPGAAGQ